LGKVVFLAEIVWDIIELGFLACDDHLPLTLAYCQLASQFPMEGFVCCWSIG
jgi:hypothetical protein